jgi:signal transduction histidine kinase
MSGWVSAILEVQRLRLGKLALDLQRVDLVKLARGCAERFQAAAGGRQVRVEVTGPAPRHVMVDRNRLSQILMGMLANVARSADGSLIEIRVGLLDGDDGRPRAVLTICNACREVDYVDIDRALESPARTLDVDLYVARETLRLHGGELWTEPHAAGQGSAAMLVLPLDFSPRSHTVLASGKPCSRSRQTL